MPSPEEIEWDESTTRPINPDDVEWDESTTVDLTAFDGASADASGSPTVEPTLEDTLRGATTAVLQGPALNWADEAAGLQAAQRAALSAFPSIGKDGSVVPATPRSERVDPGWAYRNARDRFRGLEAAFREQNPAAAFALTVGAGAGLGSPVQSTARGAARYIPNAVEGAISGIGAEDRSEAGDMMRSGALGAPFGVAGQIVGEGLGAAAQFARRAIIGLVTPSPAAQALQARGVNELTIGQMAPDSFPAQMEEVATSIGGVGPGIRAQRDAGRASWQQAVLNEALPPGAPALPAGNTIADRLDEAYRAFDEAYAPARGVPVIPQGVNALVDAADNPNVIADDGMRNAVRQFLANQLTKLRPAADGTVASDDILSMRSAIREAIRDSAEPSERRLLQTAADDLTNLLDAQLPPQAANALRTTDAAYRQYKVVEDTVRRGGDQVGGFSPSQLSQAVRAAEQPGAYARGAGGELRELAAAGKMTLDARIQPTGERLMAAGPAQWVTGPLSYMANLPGPRATLLGQAPWQQSPAAQFAARGLAATTAERVGAVGGAIGREEARGTIDVPEGDFVAYVAQNNPEALGQYADTLQRAAAQGNLPLVHWRLQQTDPNYRLMLESARKGVEQ